MKWEPSLLDANFYSILYYNCVIWLTPEINAAMNQNLLDRDELSMRLRLTLSYINLSDKLCQYFNLKVGITDGFSILMK